MSETKEKKQAIIKKFKRKEGDTGSSEVQVALLSSRIEALTEHLKKHVKDHDSRRGLLILVGQRKRLLEYLRFDDKDRYQKLLADTGIRK